MAKIIDEKDMPGADVEPEEIEDGLHAIQVYQYFLDEMSKLTSEAKIIEALTKYGIGTDSDEDRARNVKVGVCLMTSFRQFLEKEIDWDDDPTALNKKVRKRIRSMNAEKHEGLRKFEIKFVSLEETKAREQAKEEKKRKKEKDSEDEIQRILKEQKKAKKEQKGKKKLGLAKKPAPKAKKKKKTGIAIEDG